MGKGTNIKPGGGVSVAATLSLRREDKAFLGGDRIGLLGAIDRFGSITKASSVILGVDA